MREIEIYDDQIDKQRYTLGEYLSLSGIERAKFNSIQEEIQEDRDKRDEAEKKLVRYQDMPLAQKIIYNSELHKFKIRKDFKCRIDGNSVYCLYADAARAIE